MHPFELPPVQFSLKTSDGSFRNYKKKISEVIEYLEQKEKSVGTKSKAFQDAYAFLQLRLIRERKTIAGTVTSAIHIRALSKIFSEAKVSLSTNDLNHLLSINHRPSLLLISALTNFYFKHFDTITPISPDELGIWIQQAHSTRKKQISSNDKVLFSSNGADWLLQRTKQNGSSLDETLKLEKLEQYKDSRFYEIVQMTYYLKELEKLQPNESTHLFNEILKESVFKAPYKNNNLLGHRIIEILIDKIQSDVSEEWQKVVLKIAGDPRVPKDASNYRQWWIPLGEDRITKVRGWLSKVDIEMFLKVFDEYAQYKRDDGMIGMYPARRTFLMGLLNKKQVLNTRLYLSPNIQEFLKCRIEDSDTIPTNTTLKGADMAIIYLDLGNGVAMVEGTHSFKCHLYKNIHHTAVVFNYGNNIVQKQQLMSLPARDLVTIVHGRTTWQNNVIEQLSTWGILINPEDVLTEADYRSYKSKFGFYTTQTHAIHSPSDSYKTCIMCGKSKPTSEFYNSSKNSDGYSKWCKKCLDNF